MLYYVVVTPKVCYSSCHHQWQLYLVLHDKDRHKKKYSAIGKTILTTQKDKI